MKRETSAFSSDLLNKVQWAVDGSQRLLDGLGGVSAAFAAGSLLSATMSSYLSTLLIVPSPSKGAELGFARTPQGVKPLG